MMVRYSFIVAIYNVSGYLPRCINSLVSQSLDQSVYEIVLVDDGSTDGSGEICDDYSVRFSNIRAVHQENRGLLLTRATGVQKALGNYLIFIDGDDFVETNLLSVIDAKINEYKPDFLMYSMYMDYDGQIKPAYVTKMSLEVLNKKQMLERFVGTDRYNCVCGKVIKKDLLADHIEEIYDRRINIAEDKIQTSYLIKYADRIILMSDALYHYCIRQDSIARKKNKQDLIDAIYAYNRVRDVIIEVSHGIDMTECEMDRFLMVYDRNTTDAIMDHVYKFNRQKNFTESEKMNVLSDLRQNEVGFIKRAQKIRKSLKIYNRFRFSLLYKERVLNLIRVDRLLFRISSAFKT